MYRVEIVFNGFQEELNLTDPNTAWAVYNNYENMIGKLLNPIKSVKILYNGKTLKEVFSKA